MVGTRALLVCLPYFLNLTLQFQGEVGEHYISQDHTVLYVFFPLVSGGLFFSYSMDMLQILWGINPQHLGPGAVAIKTLSCQATNDRGKKARTKSADSI